MARLKKMGDGRYYLDRKVRSAIFTGCLAIWRNWFFIKSHRLGGIFDIGHEHIYVPKELVGKRLRLVAEIIEGKR